MPQILSSRLQAQLPGGGGEYTSAKWTGADKKMESPPGLGLGTLYIASFHRMTDLITRIWVQSLGIGMGRC